jgi:hypothetical protein
MPQDNISKLYGALKDTYELGSEDDFRKYLSDGNKREALRKELESEYEVGDSASFTKYLGLDTQPKPQPAKPYNPSEDDMGAGVGAAVLAKPEQAPQPNNQAKTYQITKQQQAQGGYQPTWQEQMAMGMQMGQAQNAAKNATASYDRRAKNIQEYQQKKGKQPVQLGQVSNVVQGDDGSYLTEQGSEFSQLSDANKVQGEINESRREKSVDEELQNAYAERDRLNSEMGKIQGQWVDADGRVHYGNRSNDENMQALQAAYRQNEERIKTLTYEKDNAGFWQHTGTELADLSGWNPYNAVDDAIALLRTKQKLDNGQPLEQSDNLLLANTLLSQEAHAKYDQNRNAWFRAGGIAAESIRLLPDFAVGMGPMKGIATGVAKGTGKLVTKTIGKKAAEAVAGKILSKSLGVGAGALAAGAAMVNTVQAPRLASETIGNMTGDLTLDEQGNYKFENGDSLIGAVLHAEQSLIPEAASEVTGEFLPGVGTALEKFGLKKIAGGLSRLQGTKWYKGYSKALEKVGFHGAPGEMVEEYLGDVYSAVLGDISGIAGDENGKGGWGDIDKHIDIALGTATLGSLLHAPSFINTGYNGAQYLRYRHNVNKSDKVGRDAMGDAWNPIKNAIDNTTNEDISDVMKGILQDANLSEDAKKAAFDYGVNLQKQRGHLLAIMADSKEEKDEEGKAADVLDNSYAAGYEANTLEEKQAINQNAQIAEMSLDALGEGFASWVKNEDNPPMAVLTYMMSRRDTYTDEQISAAANYYQTKFQKQGMQQAEADNMEIGEEPKPGPSYTSMEENNGLFAVNTYDKNGELLNQRAFFTEEEANAYQGEVKMQKQHQELKDLFFNPNLDIYSIQRIAEGNGVDIDTINRIVNSDPMRLSDTDLQLADELRGIMQEAVYPANEVHTDFNQQRGVEAADDAQIDTDMPNEQIVSSIVAPYIEARNNLLSLFNQNEELAEEVQMYEQMGKSEQEIISMLDTFSPEQVQTVTDFYNAQARFDGFMNRSQDKIEERVKLERGRRTFKGTINGTANMLDLVEITDGVNSYTLLNGNIETTPEGQVANVDGVIIALDQNGDFVTLGNDSNLSVLPSETTLDNWEQVYREQLQINATNAIDPTGALNPQAQQPVESPAEQPVSDEEKVITEGIANVGEGLKEAFAEHREKDVNEWIQKPQVADALRQYAQGAGSIEEMIQNAINDSSDESVKRALTDALKYDSAKEVLQGYLPVTIERVTDKDGVKRYENGISIDDAIADIEADGLNVNEEADLAINEAKTELSKIKAPKTRAERVKNAQRQQELQGVVDYYTSLKQRYAEMNQPVAEEKPISSTPSGATVEEQKQQRIVEAKQKYGENFDDDFTKANDVNELVSMWVGRNRNLAWDDVNGKRGLQKELGWTRKIGGDTKYIETLLAKKGEGVGVDEFVHSVWESPENDVNGEKRFTTEEIKEALLDLLKSAQSKSDVVDHALNSRIAQAEAMMQQQQEMEAEMAQQQEESPAEEQPIIDAGLPFGQATEEEFTNDVNESVNTENNNVSLQPNTEENEQTSMGSPNEEGDGNVGERASASNVLRGISIAASETGQSSGSKERLLVQFEESARDSGYWVEGSVNEISDLKVNVGGENEVYKSEDGSVAIKLNNFGFLRDDATSFEDLFNRLESFNELFPDVALQIVGFAKNSKGEVCVVLQQPWVNAQREATEEEIDEALEEMDFYTDRSGNWTDGQYIISDLKPNNVLVDQDGNLRFIDVVTFDETKPGQMMKAKKPEENPEPQETAPVAQSVEQPSEQTDDYLQPRDAEEEKIISDINEQLQKEIDAAIKERDKAASDLQKAKAKESERATDLFADDNAFNQEGQLFDNSDMPTDRTQEGVNRRTQAETDALAAANQKLNQLQSPEERNSRVRGALDNHRKQTSFTAETESNEQYLASHPLTEEQIMADTEATEDEKLNAIDFLKGEDDSAISRFYYDEIYNRSQKEQEPQQSVKTYGDVFSVTTNKNGSITVKDRNVIPEGKATNEDYEKLYDDFNKLGGKWEQGKGWTFRKENAPVVDVILKQFVRKIEQKPIETNNPMEAIEQAAQSFRDRWQYNFHYNKETGRAWITRDDVSGPVPLQDGRFYVEGKSLAELRGILENPKNNLGDLLKEVEAQLHNAEQLEKMRNEQETVNKRKERWQGRSEQKTQDQADIDAALKEFNDFLDNAKGSNILDKFMRKGTEGNDKLQANLLDAFTLTNEAQRMFLKDLLRLASKVGYAYIKSGVHDVQAWSKQMTDSIGKKLKDVLGWDEAIVDEFVDEVWNQKYTVDGQRMRLSEHAERLKNEKPADQTVNVNKQENNEPKNDVSLQGDSAEFADRQDKIKNLSLFIRDILRHATIQGGDATYDYNPLGTVSIKTMSGVKKLAEKLGLENMSLTDLQELVEAQIVQLAREFSETESLGDEQKFANIVRLYKIQPTLSARDNDRINKQQYSTPAPMAFLMGRFLKAGKEVKSGLEPSAGNGMLTVALPKEVMHVNDIDEMRLSNLQEQGFGEVTNQDGLKSFGEKQYDVIVTNPPFGSTAPKVYNGLYEISGLEHQMAINALESMKDDGRAAIIIGGNTEYNQNGTIKGKDRAFLNYLYAQYNVVDVINMNGHDLYSKQGTGFPVRMILINGRKEFNPKSFAPVIQKARAERVNSYDELYKRVNDDILFDTNKPASVHDTESGESRRVDDTVNAGNTTQTGVRSVRTEGSSGQSESRSKSGSGVQRGNSSSAKGTTTRGNREVGRGLFDFESGADTSEPSGSTSQSAGEQRTESGGNDTQRPVAGTDNSVGVGQRGAGTPQQNEQPVVKRGLGTEKVPYRKQSGNPFTLQSLMPAEQADVVKKSLEALGDVDQFLVNELGYSNKDELHKALAAEQIDSVAMAISQMNQGSAFIIGDQTGIGKGRQAAALIRYGVKKGGCPVFITVKKALFSDMYRDLCDIGSPKLRPFIWSADDTEHSGNVTDKNGNVVYQTPSAKEQKRVIDYINKHGKLPKEYDYVLTTYDSFKSGTMDYEDGKKTARKFPKGKKPSAVHFNGQAKRDALESLAQNSYVIMDESHNAGGEGSNVSNYLQYITTQAKGLTFLSATFAKRPGNMPIYSLKTAISKAGVKVGELIDAVKRGGATFQEIMSKALTEAGQMIRRERDMTGVTIDWKGIEDEDVIQKQREQYDTVIGLFNEIIDFQRTYVDPIVNNMNDDEAENQGEVDHTPGTRDMGINNTPFASRTYNMVQQVLLSLKAEEAAKRAIEHLKAGRKPVITVANTNEGAADEATGLSDEAMEMPDLSVNLKKGLQGTMRITKKDAFGNSTNEMIPFDKLSQEGQERYREIMDAIENASSGLSLSPIDVIKNELKKAGYKVGELTGRKAEFVYNEDGTVRRVKRQDTDKKRVAADFNNGNLDALILNRSAGTGISLHASSTFKDQRQRIMIVAQAQGDVNDEVQIRGRIDRTGQVLRGMYEYVVSQIPSEQRLLMMLKAKLRSLDANTTSSQKSKFNEMQVQDIINKYGDQIVVQYLAEHPDTYAKMADPFKWGESVYVTPAEALVSSANRPQGDGATASKILGRMALLKVAEQEKMLSELGDLYQAEIDRLNEMGENDLEITEMPLKAKTLNKKIWEEGVEPGGKNPFADNSYVETVEMDVLKKPMKGEEVKKAQARLLDGKTWDEYKQDTLDKVDSWAAEKEEETRQTFNERAEKKASAEKEKYIKGAKRMQDKNGMTDEEIERNGQSQYDTIYKEETGEKLNNALDSIEKQKQVFVDALETFNTDGVYALPTDIYDLSQITFEPSFGKVIDIKITDNYSANASTITFATLDGRRKITIPINGMVKQNNGEKKDIKPTIVQQTAQTRNGFFGRNIADMQRVLEQNVDNWDKLTSTATRKQGHIITGNLLKALTELRKQGKGGKLISYTTDTGEIRQGILMSDQFDPKTLTSKNPISSAKDDLWDWGKDRKITSADKEVVIRNDGGGWFKLLVPKSKKKGDIYFNDEKLLDLVSGQFEGSSKMAADFRQDNLDAILKRLDELGVTVESTKDDNLSETSLSNRAETEESQNNSVPLERRTLKSYTDKDGNYHKGIEEEIAELDADITRAGAEDSGVGEESSEGSSNRHDRGFRGINDLRKQVAALRAEISRRKQKKAELRKKYGIDNRGNVSLDNLARLFHDVNSDKAVGELFDKVYQVLKDLGVDFRFTDNFDGKTNAEAFAFFNVTFYNWDAFTRDLDNQERAKILLHELIHNVASHILFRYENPMRGTLNKQQIQIAKDINAIYEAVKKADPKRKDGKTPYGLKDSHEMIAELANPEFREILANIPYNGSTIWQKIKNILFRMLHIDNNTALDSLSKALDDVLDTYDAEGRHEYRNQRAENENEFKDSGYPGDYMDFMENYVLGSGNASLVEDAELIDKLDKEPKITVYRAMQLQDGKLYPPMAAKVNGKWQDPLPLGKWSQADEHPELVDKNGKFTLDKGNGKKVEGVVYAPYMHGSTTMLNDQFKEAQSRPELVVVEAEMPESELTSGYQAEKSPRTTGRVPWKAGTIQGQLTGTRDVILSRWVKPVRIVPVEEVAASIKKMIEGQVDVMPTNVVTPAQREALEKIGVKFVKTDNKEVIQEGEHKGEQYSDAYGKKSKKKSKKADGDIMEAIRRNANQFRLAHAEEEGNTPEAHSAKAVYNERLNRVETVFSEAYQDAMVSLKTAQNAIAQDKEIPDSQNAYMAENLMHGKNKNEQDLFNKMFRDPLIDTINKIMDLTGMNWGDVDRYVYTKSGLERNREFYVRDWLEAERKKTIRKYEELNDAEQDIYERLADRIERDFDDGIIATEEEKNKKLEKAIQEAHQQHIDEVENEYQRIKSHRYVDLQCGNSLELHMDTFNFADYLSQIDRFITGNINEDYEPSEHDYSGFRAMYGDENGKYDEADIIAELMVTEEQIEDDNVFELWENINNATQYGLDRYREAGMRSDETIDRVENMFHWYVPMRGFKDDTGEDMYQYFTGKGKEKSYVGGLLKHAKGRGSEANYPISTIFAMTYKAISDCNQNLVNQKLYRLCQANPNDLIVLSDSWAVLNETTGEWEEKCPEIPEDATEDDVRQITLAWEGQMRQLAQEDKAKKITGKAHFDYVPMDKKKKSEHIVDVRINGQPKQMIVTSNPRMAQALNGQLRFERGHNVFSKWNANIKNMMASLFTSYSPTFALRNMMRDWTHFRTMLGVREGHGYAKQANKYYRQSLFKMVGLFKKYREDRLDMDKEIERDFKDFMDNGGITGYVQMNKIDEIQKEMEKLYKDQKAGKPIKFNNAIWDYTLGAIEAVNEGIENNARFATFRASRHYAGRTKARSAYDAKEITVNFNRKGAGGKTYGYKSASKKVEDAAKAFGVTSQILGEGRIFFNATVQAVATTFKNFQKADGSLNKPYIAKWAAKYALPPFLFGLALPMINKALAAALGGDDDDPYANLAEWTRRRNLCFYIGNDNCITIPIGQELAAFLTLGDMVAGMTYAPELKPIDRSFDDEMLGVMSTFSPVDIDTKITKGGILEDPISEVTGRTFSVLAPLVAVEQNLGWTGRPIYREDKFQNDRFTPEYQMVYQSTNQVLVDASKLLHEIGGGDDIVRGKLEVNPAIVQYLLEQYTGGPGKVFSNTISLGRDFSDFIAGKETDFNMRKVEGVKAFVQQGDDRTAYYRTQAKYRKYSEDAKKLYHDVKGYENAAPSDPMAMIKLENISKSDDFVRMQIVREADKELSRINKAANKAEGKERKELRKLYNEQVKAVVDMLDEVGKD